MDKTSKAIVFGAAFFILMFIGIYSKSGFAMFLGIVSLVIMFIFVFAGNKEQIDKSSEEFLKVLKNNNFVPNKKVLSFNLLNGLAINEQTEKIAIVSRYTENDQFKFKTFNFKDIIEAKVITNYSTVTSTSTGSAIARGMFAGLIFGSIGSIVGGVTANKTSSQKIKELTLEIVIDDILNPRQIITFYKRDVPLNDTNPIIHDIEEWYRSFSVIINRNQKARSV